VELCAEGITSKLARANRVERLPARRQSRASVFDCLQQRELRSTATGANECAGAEHL